MSLYSLRIWRSIFINSRAVTEMTLEEDFRKAAEIVKKLKQKPSEDEMLTLYALYKQAEFGDCNIPKPGMLDFTGKVKWDAWNNKKGLSQDAAREQYISQSDELVKKYGVN